MLPHFNIVISGHTVRLASSIINNTYTLLSCYSVSVISANSDFHNVSQTFLCDILVLPRSDLKSSGWLVGWFAGAGAAPSHPWSGSPLCGKLRPPQRRADVRVRQTRAAARAAECSGSRKGLRCRNESAAQIFQRSLSTAVSPQLSVNTHTKPVLVINRCSLLNS